jgi:hypothetical protein
MSWIKIKENVAVKAETGRVKVVMALPRADGKPLSYIMTLNADETFKLYNFLRSFLRNGVEGRLCMFCGNMKREGCRSMERCIVEDRKFFKPKFQL